MFPIHRFVMIVLFFATMCLGAYNIATYVIEAYSTYEIEDTAPNAGLGRSDMQMASMSAWQDAVEENIMDDNYDDATHTVIWVQISRGFMSPWYFVPFNRCSGKAFVDGRWEYLDYAYEAETPFLRQMTSVHPFCR